MANTETACGVRAYTKDSSVSGGQAWENYRKNLAEQARQVVSPFMSAGNTIGNDRDA
jgi:hypothetical protein